jgi:hypothetical protein
MRRSPTSPREEGIPAESRSSAVIPRADNARPVPCPILGLRPHAAGSLWHCCREHEMETQGGATVGSRLNASGREPSRPAGAASQGGMLSCGTAIRTYREPAPVGG